MNKALQVAAGFAAPIAIVLIVFIVGAAAQINTEGPVLLMALVAVFTLIGLCAIMHWMVGWRHFFLGVLSAFGFAILLAGGCFVLVAVVR